MKLKKLASFVAVASALSLCSACGNTPSPGAAAPEATPTPVLAPLPVATPNPNILHPEGRTYEADGALFAEGGLASLHEDHLVIMVEGDEVELKYSEKAKREVSIYNRDPNNLQLMQGTMLQIRYTEQNGVKTAEQIFILQSN